MSTLTIGSLFQECDFCRRKGIVGETLFNQDGWYFCEGCLREIETKNKGRWEKKFADSKAHPSERHTLFRAGSEAR